ncbi:DNA methyltransferase [candidate division WOR-3 bacterium]|nr:DNA methyltransferase [candidate division WOR-3 bacterium]
MKTATCRTNGDNNKMLPLDRAAHDWYRFVLSFPPHLVRDYLERFEVGTQDCVLDPFCGTGTTLVECKKQGIASIGVESNPMAWFASKVKTDWDIEPDGLRDHASRVADLTLDRLEAEGIRDDDGLPFRFRDAAAASRLRALPEEVTKLILKDSISPLPLHKTLELIDCLNDHKDGRLHDHEQLALASAIVGRISNLHFGPEVGVATPKSDAAVVGAWLDNVRTMVRDLRELRELSSADSTVLQADARDLTGLLKPESIEAVITSPPYPNEKDYTRTTRLESVLLGFIRSKQDLRSLKQNMVRSNTRGVYRDDNDDQMVSAHEEIRRIADAIEKRRVELGKTSGFERLYARVTKLYFGGMARHLKTLCRILRPGARLAYVVGDQASYLRVMIRTGTLLADIAQSLGYEVMGVDLFRTRLATATREQLREEVVLLRWPGSN